MTGILTVYYFLTRWRILMLLNAKEIILQRFKYNVMLSLFKIKAGVEQVNVGMRSENLSDGIVNKFISVENMLKEHLPLSFIYVKLKELSAEKRWKDFYLIKI